MVSAACSSVDEPKIVLMAATMTMAITISITIYALTTKKDFTVKIIIFLLNNFSFFCHRFLFYTKIMINILSF